MKIIKMWIVIFFCTALTSCNSLMYLEEEKHNDTEKDNIFTYTESDDRSLSVQPSITAASRLIFQDEYMFFKDQISLVRFNMKTGNKTYVCSDPVCSHQNTDCPLYGYYDFIKPAVIYKDGIYYQVQYTYPVYENGVLKETVSVNDFRYYDLSSQKQSSIFEIEQGEISIGEYLIHNDKYYFYRAYSTENNQLQYYMNRLDLKTKKVDEKLLISAIDGTAPYNIICGINNDIYFASYPLGEIFSYPENDFSEKKTIYKTNAGESVEQAAYNDGYFYFITVNHDNNTTKLCRIDLSGEHFEVIYMFDNILRNIFYTENYMYYCRDITKYIGKIQDTDEELNIKDTTIYRLSYREDTPNEKCVFKFTGEMETYSLNYFAVSGNYIYSYYSTWGTPKDIYNSQDGYNSNIDSEIMRIDITTGEIYYVK